MAPPPETLPPPPLPLSPRRHGRRSIVSAPQSPGASPGCTPAAAGAAGEPQRAERRKPFPSRAGDRMVTCRLQSYRTKRDRRAAALTSWHQQGPVPIMLQLNRAHACPSLAAAHCASCDPGALPLPSSPALGFGPRSAAAACSCPSATRVLLQDRHCRASNMAALAPSAAALKSSSAPALRSSGARPRVARAARLQCRATAAPPEQVGPPLPGAAAASCRRPLPTVLRQGGLRCMRHG